MNKIKTYLPGTDKQFQIFSQRVNYTNKELLIIGSGCEEIAKQVIKKAASVFVIVEDQESLIQTRFNLSGEKNITTRLMNFENTDFPSEKFDIIYAQASVSNSKRNKIIKEVVRLLKPAGIFYVGEIVSLSESPPTFVKDIWESSDINPLYKDDLGKFYEKRNFKILYDGNLSYTLKDFYFQSMELLNENKGVLSDEEKKQSKKLINKISHESNVYLKLGGNEHIGFKVLIMTKGQQ
jgi:ubiquinone/menaquinone biosynthesis C-methylase UbiE